MPDPCESNPGAIALEFPTTGVEVAPFEADIRRDQRKYAYGNFRMAEPAGDLVAEEVDDWSLVYVWIDDTRGYRFLYRRENLTYKRDLYDQDIVELELLDPAKVLANGTITKNFDTAYLGDIVDYILKQYDDPDDVITDYEFITSGDRDMYRYAAEDIFVPLEYLATLAGEEPPVGQDFFEWLGQRNLSIVDTVDEVLGTNMTGGITGGFNWERETPLAAFHEVMNEFELDWWVTPDGVLKIGIDGSYGQIIGVAGSHKNNFVISKYGVTSNPDLVSGVLLEGPAIAYRQDNGGYEYDVLRAIAEVNDTSADGRRVAASIQKNVESLDELEGMAKRQLTREVMSQASGSLEINGLASERSDVLSMLDVGDVLVLDDSINVSCDRELVTGNYLIQGVQHKHNSREGWIVNVEVASIPDSDNFDVRSVYYDPETDKNYDSMEEYREETNESRW